MFFNKIGDTKKRKKNFLGEKCENESNRKSFLQDEHVFFLFSIHEKDLISVKTKMKIRK